MIQVNILEQLKILLNIFISNQYVFYISIIGLGSLLILEFANRIKNKKVFKILCILGYIVGLGILLWFYHKEILLFIDYLIDNIFILLFFPNLAIYTLVIILINIILMKSMFIEKDNKILRHMNIVFFVLFNIIFYLIIDNVLKNNVNIYESLSIYTNNNLLNLISLSMKLFLIWIVLLLVARISSKLTRKFEFKKKKQLILDSVINEEEYSKIQEVPRKISKIKEPTTYNSLTAEDSIPEYNNLESLKHQTNYVDMKPINNYNDYIDIRPIKKKTLSESKLSKNYLLSSMDELFKDNNDLNVEIKDMDVVFGKSNYLDNIMNDIEKLKNNQNDYNQIQKIYKEISLNSKDLTLNDYNYLINALVDIKNSN